MFNLSKQVTGAKAKAMQTIRDDVKRGKLNWIETAKQQGLPVSEKPFEAPKFELFPEIKEVSPEEKKQIEEQQQIRLQRLEEELKQLRIGRQQTDQQWEKRQEEIMNPEEAARAAGKEPPRREIIIPPPKPKGPSGAKRATQAKQGSREAGRQKST